MDPTGSWRADPKLYAGLDLVGEQLGRISSPRRFGDFATFSNGANLPKKFYSDAGDETAALYLSVRGISGFVFRADRCNELRDRAELGAIIEGSAVRPTEVLLVRSRATGPGAAMSSTEIDSPVAVVPSGFVIRAGLPDSESPTYVTAILNHPVWRTLTAALGAGKSQDNLSQESLAYVPFPSVSKRVQKKIELAYTRFLEGVKKVQEDDGGFTRVCDQIVESSSGLTAPHEAVGRVRVSKLSLAEVASSRALRLDNRWHGPSLRAVREALAAESVQSVGSLVGPISKGRQPAKVDETSLDTASEWVIATSSFRGGRVVDEWMKPTDANSISRFPVVAGDLLVAMDGDGSVGKAAIYEGDDAVTVDSHVARMKADIPSVTSALACWLNSSWGRIQTAGMMSGATGQTQLSPTDLLTLEVPSSLIADAASVETAYLEAVASFTPPSVAVRQLLGDMAAEVSRLLIVGGAIDSMDAHFWSREAIDLLARRLYPSDR